MEDHVVIITGAAGDIGCSVTKSFLDMGASVFAVDSSPQKLEQLRQEGLGSNRFKTAVCNVTSEDQVRDAIRWFCRDSS